MDGYFAPFGEVLEGFDLVDTLNMMGIDDLVVTEQAVVPVIVKAGEWHVELDNPDTHDYDGL